MNRNCIKTMILGAAGALVFGTPHLCRAEITSDVLLPPSYEEEAERHYPVVYLLPEDGAGETDTVVLDALKEMYDTPEAMDTIIVAVDLEGCGPDDLWPQMQELVEETDATYRTVPESYARAVAGTGVGGYLASLLTFTDGEGGMLEEPAIFGMSGGISPDYQSETVWRESYGDFLDILQAGHLNNGIATRFFTFIQTPSESDASWEKDGANDVIAGYIRMGAAYGGFYDAYYGNADNTVLDLTIPHAKDDEAFRKKAAEDMARAFSRKIMSGIGSGTLRLSPQAAGADLETVDAGYTLNLSDAFTAFTGKDEGEITLRWEITDPQDETVLTGPMELTASFHAGENSQEACMALPNLVEGEHSDVTLTASLLGAEVKLDTKPLVRIMETGTETEEQFVDLMGLWKFEAASSVKPSELPAKEEYEKWEEVIPCLTWWNEDFSADVNMKAYVGYAWYIREFDIPADFPEGTYKIPLGGFDETDMVWINGTRIGYTGLNGDTWQHEEDKWDTIRVYEADSDILNIGGANEIVILTHNASGDGGWYSGHPGIYTEAAYQTVLDAQAGTGAERFEQVVIDSAKKASALGLGEDTAEETFLVYLPEEYDDPQNAEKQYPVIYLFHQLNSSSNSYVLDGIDRLLDQGIRDGRTAPAIVVIPDSAPDSWWMGDWEKMVTEEIIPYVDEHYRTFPDAAHRYTAGASMGGHGSFLIGLSHPELFSGIISYFGAINMGANPVGRALGSHADFLGQFRFYFVCSNRDLYKFGIPAIQLDRHLREEGVSHYFELGEGEHDSTFYLPYVVDSVGYVTESEGQVP